MRPVDLLTNQIKRDLTGFDNVTIDYVCAEVEQKYARNQYKNLLIWLSMV